MKDCTIASPLTTYDLSKTGVWGDAIRFRKPIIINDYKNCINKKGYPTGHVVLKNFLTIPVFRNNKIVALSGVANKDSDYTAEDIENLTAFLNHVWGTFEKLDLVELLKSYTTDLEKIIEDKIVKYKKMNLLLRKTIDKRKKLLSAVHESNRAMTIVLKELNTCVAIISLDTKQTIELNDHAELFFEKGKSFFIGQECTKLGICSNCELCYFENIDSSKYEGSIEINARYKTFEAKRIKINFFGQNCVMIIFKDTTEKNKVERQKLLAQKLESIGALAAGIAHEINTPIQYIESNIDFIHNNITQCFDQQYSNIEEQNYLKQEIVTSIRETQEGIQKIKEITSAVKKLSHPSTSKEIYDLVEIIKTVIKISTNEWKYYSDIVFDCDNSKILYFCNSGEITQAILNIIVNSAHAIESLHKDKNTKGQIRILCQENDECITIRISDNGIGISPENIDKVFDPYFTTKPVGKGTGQGLAITHDIIVSKHKGLIEVSSTPGNGTSFRITLPK